jgi:hypothetical protein
MSFADLHNPDSLAECERSDSELLLVIRPEAAPLGAKPRDLEGVSRMTEGRAFSQIFCVIFFPRPGSCCP